MIKEIKDLKDIESNIFEKEADLDENITNIEYFLSSDKSQEGTEEKGKINNEKYIKNENNDKNIIEKDKNNQYFSLKEIYDENLTKSKNKVSNENMKRFYNSFGGIIIDQIFL